MFRINLQPARPAWHAPVAVACFVLAAIAGFGGSLLTTNAILNAHDHPTLYAVGLTSLILALPMAILGAHCLDLMDRRQEQNQTLFSGFCLSQAMKRATAKPYGCVRLKVFSQQASDRTAKITPGTIKPSGEL